MKWLRSALRVYQVVLKVQRCVDLENDLKKLADLAWKSRKPIDQGGMLKFVFDKEYHAFNPT